jgi:AcrR family transcriptional regulator
VQESETRERIVVEATRLLAVDGLAGFSMRRLADRLGLSAAALYRHYDDKQALLVAACAEGFARFGQALFKALEADGDWERLRQTGTQYYHFAYREPHFYRVMFMIPGQEMGWEKIPEEHQKRLSSTFEFLVDRVRAVQSPHPVSSLDDRALSASIWAHCHGLMALRLDCHFDDMDDDAFFAFYRSALDAHLSGLWPHAT